jgi:tetratricopeptide (TPR) repeat protein
MCSEMRRRKQKYQRLRDMNVFEQSAGTITTPIPQDFLGITDDQLTNLYRSALLYIEQEDPTNAVRSFTLLCHLHPYIPEFWYGLGLALHALRIFEEALSAFLMAETLNPHWFEFYEKAIRCALDMENVKEARHILARLLAHSKKIDNFAACASKVAAIKKELSTV